MAVVCLAIAVAIIVIPWGAANDARGAAEKQGPPPTPLEPMPLEMAVAAQAAEPIPALEVDPRQKPLEDYVLVALQDWTRGGVAYPLAPLPEVAHDIAEAALGEESIWPSDSDRHRSAIQIAAVARNEGGLWDFVDSGRCNAIDWRKSLEGGRVLRAWDHVCDSRNAFSLCQIHFDDKWQLDGQLGGGIALTEGGGWYLRAANPGRHEGQVVHGRDAIADRRLAFRVALRMERGVGGGFFPDGSSERADKWLAKHPYPGP
jgi:hypothetical protein